MPIRNIRSDKSGRLSPRRYMPITPLHETIMGTTTSLPPSTPAVTAIPGQATPTPAGPASAGHHAASGAKPDTPAIDAAKTALAKAESDVDTDKRNHSPSCVIYDQKIANNDQEQLAQAEAAAQNATNTSSPASQLDITV